MLPRLSYVKLIGGYSQLWLRTVLSKTRIIAVEVNPGVNPENPAMQGLVLCPSGEMNLLTRQIVIETISDLTHFRSLLFGSLCFKQAGACQYSRHCIVAFMTGVFI